jgi:hypothetical protein
MLEDDDGKGRDLTGDEIQVASIWVKVVEYFATHDAKPADDLHPVLVSAALRVQALRIALKVACDEAGIDDVDELIETCFESGRKAYKKRYGEEATADI